MNSKEKMCFEFITFTNILKRYIDNSTAMKYAEKYTGNNIWILGFLFHNKDKDVFQKDIEEFFSVRRSTVSKAVKLMVQKGLIRREPVEYDARLKKLILTEKAMEINEVIESQMKDMGEKFTANLTDEEIEEFSRILGKIRKSFESGCENDSKPLE